MPNQFLFSSESWEMKKLGDIASVKMGQSPDGKSYSDDPTQTVLIQGNADMRRGKVVPRIYTSEGTKFCSPNDIIMSVRAPVGALARTDINACLGRGVCAITGPDYVYYYLTYFQNKGGWDKISQGTTFEAVNSKDITNLMVPVPSLPEQKHIAEFFAALDERIALQSRKVKLLREQKRGYQQRVFNRELVFTDDNGNPYPEWEQQRVGELVSITTGKKDANAMVQDGKYAFFTCSREVFSIDSYSFEGEAILLAGNGNIGEPKYYNGKFDAYQRTYVLQNFSGIKAKYLLEAIEYFFPSVVLRETQTGSMPYIRLATLSNLKVPVPSLPEQETIAGFFSALDENIELNERKLALLKEEKQGYLQAIFG